MKAIFIKTISIILFSVFLISCTDDNEIIPVDPLQGYSKLQGGYALGASVKVEVWGQKNFFMGYNKLIVLLYDSLNQNEKLTDAQIQFMPLMTMNMNGMTIKHSAPVENPDAKAIDEVFPGAVAFQMPTATDGTWELRVSVHNSINDKKGIAKFDITVESPNPAVMRVFSALAPDNNKLVLSLLEPLLPKVGMNDIEFTIHRKSSMMEWPADDSYTIEITPEMPSMGHGSPNNVNPENSGNGHYKGKVNFTMTGEWRINVLVKKDGLPISSNLYFDITF